MLENMLENDHKWKRLETTIYEIIFKRQVLNPQHWVSSDCHSAPLENEVNIRCLRSLSYHRSLYTIIIVIIATPTFSIMLLSLL